MLHTVANPSHSLSAPGNRKKNSLKYGWVLKHGADVAKLLEVRNSLRLRKGFFPVVFFFLMWNRSSNRVTILTFPCSSSVINWLHWLTAVVDKAAFRDVFVPLAAVGHHLCRFCAAGEDRARRFIISICQSSAVKSAPRQNGPVHSSPELCNSLLLQGAAF